MSHGRPGTSAADGIIAPDTEATLTIDRTASLCNSSVWLFSGSKVTIIAPGEMRTRKLEPLRLSRSRAPPGDTLSYRPAVDWALASLMSLL